MRRACRITAGWLLLFCLLSWGAAGLGLQQAHAAAEVELYTPYTDLSAPPGDSIAYSVDIINRSNATQNVELSFDTGGNDWKYELTAGGRTIHSVAVKPGESQSVNLQLGVPLKINKGSYTFQLSAKGGMALPLKVNVNEQGTFSTEFTAEQANMEGHADTTFSFSTTLHNRTADEQTYALTSGAQEGWDVRFKNGGNSVTSVKLAAGATQTIDVDVVPPQKIKAGSYKIPLSAANNSTSADTMVEAVITGTYDMTLSTADERLNADVTAGSQRKLNLVVTNTGSAELQDINLSSQAPTDWEVTFEPATIRSIAPGQTAQVQATIKADKQALAGDYVVNLSASSAQKSADAAIRVAVKTSVLWGWIGVLIIAAVIAAIAYLFRKYGRR